MEAYLGIDVGSVTVKFAVLNTADELIASLYLPAGGRPVAVVQQGLGQIGRQLPPDIAIKGVATTGSARYLAGAIVGADLVKNEITCQAVAAVHYFPDVRTVIEIGGQDSKLILIRDGMVADFAMNTVCAAGTGCFPRPPGGASPYEYRRVFPPGFSREGYRSYLRPLHRFRRVRYGP